MTPRALTPIWILTAAIFSLLLPSPCVRSAANSQNLAEIRHLKSQIARQPANIRANVSYQDLLLAAGRRAEVVEFYRQRLNADPVNAASIYLYSRLLTDEDERLEHLERAYALDREVFEICVDLGRAYYHQGDYDEAVARYKRAIRLRSTSAFARNLLGLAYYHKGYVDLAISEYRQAIRIRDGFLDPYLNLGLTYYYTGKLDDAIGIYKQALKLPEAGKEKHRIYRNLGMAYARKGDDKKAEKAYLSALDLDPESADVYLSLGNLAFNRGDYAEATRSYELAAKNGENNARLHLKLGLSHFNLSDYGSAATHLGRSLDLDPTQIDARYYLGLAYFGDGENQMARKALEAYVEREKRLSKNAVVYKAKLLLDDIDRKLIREMY
jgi:tetratricopeptide (TPR) repeat protein